MHIRILETDEPPAPLDHGVGGDPAMFKRFLSPLAPDSPFSSIAILTGQPAPAIDSPDALLITRSPTADSLQPRRNSMSQKVVDHAPFANWIFNSSKTDEC